MYATEQTRFNTALQLYCPVLPMPNLLSCFFVHSEVSTGGLSAVVCVRTCGRGWLDWRVLCGLAWRGRLVCGSRKNFCYYPPPPTESHRLLGITETFCYYPPPLNRVDMALHTKVGPLFRKILDLRLGCVWDVVRWVISMWMCGSCLMVPAARGGVRGCCCFCVRAQY